jgi:predicted ribosomally synthesized peptide with nif11-like leader
MSQQALKDFQKLVNSRPDLKDQMQKHTNKVDLIKAAVALGTQHGHEFTEQEVQDVIEGPNSAAGKLSDHELSSAAGGGQAESYTYSKPGCNH